MRLDPEQIAWRKRHIESIQAMDDETLLFAYSYGYTSPNLDPFDPMVKTLIDSRLSMRLFEAVTQLNSATQRNSAEVIKLAESSTAMERLTASVRDLTVWLLALTIVAILAPIAIELWKVKREIDAPPPPILIQYSVPSVPQMRTPSVH